MITVVSFLESLEHPGSVLNRLNEISAVLSTNRYYDKGEFLITADDTGLIFAVIVHAYTDALKAHTTGDLYFHDKPDNEQSDVINHAFTGDGYARVIGFLSVSNLLPEEFNQYKNLERLKYYYFSTDKIRVEEEAIN